MFEDKTMEIFSSRDMIRQQLITYAESYLELTNVDLTKQSYLSYIINVLSVLTSNLIYYNTATYREFFLVRAHQKESVLNLAAMLGYVPDVATPATSQVLVSIPTSFRSSTTIVMYGRNDPDHDAYKFYAGDTVFSCQNEIQINVVMDRGRFLVATILEINKTTGGTRGINWRLTEDKKYLSFMVNVTQVEDQVTDFNFPVLEPYEYYTKTIDFSGDFAGVSVKTVSTEKAIEDYWDEELSRRIQNAYDVAQSDYVEWEEKSSLFLVSAGEYGYTYRLNDKGVKIFFGNGIIGTQPKTGDSCTITVSITKGYDGNVIAGAINQSERLYCTVVVEGVSYELPVNLKCINPSAALGGQSYPTIDELRSQAITQVSTNSRLVSEYDFENAGDVVRDLPIQHSIPILKRSDLKRNEICLFTDIVFGNEYVPTKNAVIKIPVGSEQYPIRYRDDVVLDLGRFEQEEDYEGLNFVSMFDIQVDATNNTCSYFYTLMDYETEAILQKTWSNDTVLYPHTSKFEVIRDETSSINDILTVKFYYTKTTTNTKYDTLSCSLEINESGIFSDMTAVDSSGGTYFYIEKDLSDIEEGSLPFDFQVKYYDSSQGTYLPVCNCTSETVVKQSLDEFMYSKVKRYNSLDEDSEGGLYWGIIYDVPVILKDYLTQLDSDEQSDNFVDQILHRIVTFDVTQYKMLTDFVNLKFSDTYGNITNMNYNPSTKGIVHRIDPEIIPDCPGNGFTCAVTNDNNVWSVSPWNKRVGGFLARYYDSAPGNWVFTNLKTNDIILYDYISPEDNQYRVPIEPPEDYYSTKLGNLSGEDRLPKMIYNGDNLFSMSNTIPLEITLEVWKSTSTTTSDSGLISAIRNAIIDHFLNKMGYDKPIYISDITAVVQEITGVDYCKVVKPDHDIFFNYNFNDFEQEDLLRYSPQLVYMASSMISITIRKRTDLRLS